MPTDGRDEAVTATGLREAAGNRLLIGTAIMARDLDDPRHAGLIAGQFNCLTAGTEMKPDALQNARGGSPLNGPTGSWTSPGHTA